MSGRYLLNPDLAEPIEEIIEQFHARGDPASARGSSRSATHSGR
jgi:hypothetical protein